MFERYGPPDVIAVREVPRPTPADGDVLVRVRATTVNRTDCGFRSASPFVIRFMTGLRRPRPDRMILGCEFAGDVVAVGSSVTGFAVGDRVFGYDDRRLGCNAEYVSVDAGGSIATIPDGIAWDVAAAATEGAHYALAFLRVSRVGAGSAVLVNGATGAIGSAAVQLLAHAGAEVTAVCRGEHADLVRELGAHRVIDHLVADFTRDPAAPGPYDAVFDTVGTSSFGRCRHLLAPAGCYVSSELGRGLQNLPLALVTPLFRRRHVRFPYPHDGRAVVDHLRSLLASGDLRPVIDRRYALDDVVEAHRYVESGRKVGNVVIDPAG